MTLIIALILIGMFLLVVEILILPGITVAAIGALAACGYAVYRGFVDYGNAGGLIALAAVLVLSVAVGMICLRARTWRRFTLKENIDGTSQEVPDESKVKVGDTGTAVSRLAPMGKVIINGQTYEAKSIDSYIDQQKEVVVTGVENFNLIVKLADKAND